MSDSRKPEYIQRLEHLEKLYTLIHEEKKIEDDPLVKQINQIFNRYLPNFKNMTTMNPDNINKVYQLSYNLCNNFRERKKGIVYHMLLVHLPSELANEPRPISPPTPSTHVSTRTPTISSTTSTPSTEMPHIGYIQKFGALAKLKKALEDKTIQINNDTLLTTLKRLDQDQSTDMINKTYSEICQLATTHREILGFLPIQNATTTSAPSPEEKKDTPAPPQRRF